MDCDKTTILETQYGVFMTKKKMVTVSFYRQTLLGVFHLIQYVYVPGEGGNYYTYRCGMCHFLVSFISGRNESLGVIFGKITRSHKFWAVILEK